jgi:hypothetical protein
LNAADGQDALDGGPGDDIIGTGPTPGGIRPAQGPDTISGGGGNDRVDFSQRTQPVTVDLDGEADDGEADERDNVQPDVEEVIGGSNDDTLIGSSAANVLEGRDGQDTIEGGAGDDVMRGGSGDDSLAGGDGNDKELTGGGGGDRVEGGGGNDSLEGGAGADALDGGDGDDGLNGGGRNLVGADGPDDLIGGPGRDILLGGRGNDRLDGGLGADYLSGESEKDTVTYEDRTNPVFVTLDGDANDGEKGEGDNVLPDVEEILGGFGGDDLYGNVGDNTVEGGTGEDLIDGKRSPDRLLGADASDLVMARDGLRDEVACGDGGDLVIADDGDKVIDCETVDRPRSRDAVLGSYALLSPLRPRRKGARVAQQQEAAVGLRLPQGGRFYPLEQFFQLVRTFQIPIGSTIRAEDGEVQLTTASDRGRGRKHVSASLGRFTVYQRGGRRAVTRLSLAGKLPSCGRGSTQRGTAKVAARSRPRKLRTREKGEGKVEVEGKYSTGASYGTDWLTEDRCDGTLTTVFKGSVLVQDFGQKKKVVVRAGHSYLAKKP